ncbi:DNA adenine methylase [Geodermatophilus africanus]|uniref:DNA adenine methylase n=1 Tax=Geodermatophilus africanus TaxID=1137993 RepID=A0A1H3M906_9ACTN|nr:DNA adenine methylase [Geodermatophilus africanus]SDY73056.1 DNA adenine methylase [Geodermatophilus africanus]
MPRPTKRLPTRQRPWAPDAVLDKPKSLENPKFFDQSVLSPLRYPGAKRQLTPIIEGIIRANVPPPRLLVEPFCGGATTALRLVGSGAVEHVILADADPLVSSFWYTAAFETTWLINRMQEEEVSVARWDWWRAAEPTSRREQALKCLFLNRTTFSGILHGRAGPIGGRAQTSAYKIDCRFGKEGLARRIRAIGELADTGRILDVWPSDWATTLQRVKRTFGDLDAGEITVYLDPPYVEKAPYLYEWSFEDQAHEALAEALRDCSDFRWLLSYDDNPVARNLYPDGGGRTSLLVPHRYTAAGSNSRTVRDELLVTNYPDIPDSDRYRSVTSPVPSV